MFEAFLECGHFTEPALVVRLAKAILGVLRHLLDSVELGRIDPQEPASGAGMLMDAGRSVGPVTFTQGDSAQQEVLLEVRPLVGISGTVFAVWPQLSTPRDERLMRCDQVLGEHRGVAAGGVEIEVAEQ